MPGLWWRDEDEFADPYRRLILDGADIGRCLDLVEAMDILVDRGLPRAAAIAAIVLGRTTDDAYLITTPKMKGYFSDARPQLPPLRPSH